MLKKLMICACLTLFFFGNAHSETPGQKPIDARIYNDTTKEKTDSLNSSATPMTDPKEGFKDLFVATTSDDGVTMAELNPLAVSFVEDYMDKFGKKMENMKVNGKPYFDMMDAVLVQHGLPKELKYLAVIESFLKPNARSGAGAVGPWQFMPATARKMGLKVGPRVDERRDLVKSTHAASKYLSNLFDIYGDWLLVIAAYNCGSGNVNSAIKRSGSKDFWKLQSFLPAESRNHVKKFIATHYMMEGEGGITTLTKSEAAERMLADANNVTVDMANAKLQAITGRYNSAIIARYLTMDVSAFNKLNPSFDKTIASAGKYDMRLPADKMDLFLSRKWDILNESVQMLLNPDAITKAKTTTGTE